MRRDTEKIKSDILEFLTTNGPSLPIQISKYIKVDSLFTSAFLSELLGLKKIKMSHMRVGLSSIYFIPGSQAGLEKYSEYLKSKEKEAYNLLKTHSFLEDEIEHPAIRIALREIKDFAIPFKRGNKFIWRYYLINENDYQEIKSKTIQVEIQKEEIIQEKPKEEKEEIKEDSKKSEKTNILEEKEKSMELQRIFPEKEEEISKFINPLAKKIEIKKSKEKPRSKFCLSVMEFILDNKWKIVKEISHKTKEYSCLVQISSDLGPIIFFTNAKDKKTVTESDMTKILGEAQLIPLPALLLSTGTIQKKAQIFLEEYSSVLKVKQIK